MIPDSFAFAHCVNVSSPLKITQRVFNGITAHNVIIWTVMIMGHERGAQGKGRRYWKLWCNNWCFMCNSHVMLIVVSLRMPQEFVGLPCLETTPWMNILRELLDIFNRQAELNMVSFFVVLSGCSEAGLVDEGLGKDDGFNWWHSWNSGPSYLHSWSIGCLYEAEHLVKTTPNTEDFRAWIALLGALQNSW